MSDFSSSVVEQDTPDYGNSTFNIKVIHEYEVVVLSNSTFGDLKSVIVQKTGLKPETLKLLFRGIEKEDDDDLLTSGVKDNSQVLVMDAVTCTEEIPEEVKEPCVVSRGEDAVAKVRDEVDMLFEQVSALQVVVDGGTKVDDKDIIYLSEMLMRQLLKLDTIDAEGEGKMQRRVEVLRVQSCMETVDVLKSKNSDPSYDFDNRQTETFEPTHETIAAASQMPSPTPESWPSPASVPEELSDSFELSSAPSPVPSSTSIPDAENSSCFHT